MGLILKQDLHDEFGSWARRNGGCDKTGSVRVVAGNATGDCHDDAHHPAGSRDRPAARCSQATFEN
jgi:hypothetical protein